MKPIINNFTFGAITVDQTIFDHDILIRMDGKIEKRKKKLSKSIYGTSHTISLNEAKHVFENGMEKLIIGTGMFDRCRLSDEASQFFNKEQVKIILLPTKKAAQAWNKSEGHTAALIHITC